MTNPLSFTLTRRNLLGSFGSLLALSATGCATTVPELPLSAAPAFAPPPSPPLVSLDASPALTGDEDPLLMYAAMPNERFPIPAVDLQRLDPRYIRRTVDYVTAEMPGTVVVDTATRYLYHVGSNGTATRYGAGIGAGGFAWSGRAHIAYKREWPVWTPPDAMIQRQPRLEKWRNGQPPGITNPLGARALYIHQGNQDTLYRIHGTGEAHTIGKAVSSGCVRLLHQDVIHLHDHVRSGSPIVVLASDGTAPPASA
jgi:lipoprotein-anchoring transpeptidase ErfK/SrfK